MKKTALFMALLLCISSMSSANCAAGAQIGDWEQAKGNAAALNMNNLESLWKKRDSSVRLRRLSEALKDMGRGEELVATCGLWGDFRPAIPFCELLLVAPYTQPALFDNGRDRILHRRE